MILIIDMYGQKDALRYMEFVKPIERIVKSAGKPFLTKHFSSVTFDDLEYSDKVIMCGTPLGDTAYLARDLEFAWLQMIDKPVLGICAGMQTIAKAFGSHEERCTELGKTEVTRVSEDALIDGLDIRHVYCLHSVKMSLPDGFVELLRTQNGPHLIKHKTKPIYGALFHPEAMNKEIIERFLAV